MLSDSGDGWGVGESGGAWRRRRIIEGDSQEEKCGKAKHCPYFYVIIFGSPMGLGAFTNSA